MNLFDQNIQKLRIIWEHKVPYDARPKITSSGDVFEVFIRAFDEGTIDYKEFFYVMLLNRANKVLAIHKVSEGGLSGTVADPKVIFQTALLAKATSLFTGADLKALAERAAEDALARSLRTGKVHEVAPEHFKRALGAMQSTASEWLATARNYAQYANEGGQYDDLADFLKRIKKW